MPGVDLGLSSLLEKWVPVTGRCLCQLSPRPRLLSCKVSLLSQGRVTQGPTGRDLALWSRRQLGNEKQTRCFLRTNRCPSQGRGVRAVSLPPAARLSPSGMTPSRRRGVVRYAAVAFSEASPGERAAVLCSLSVTTPAPLGHCACSAADKDRARGRRSRASTWGCSVSSALGVVWKTKTCTASTRSSCLR